MHSGLKLIIGLFFWIGLIGGSDSDCPSAGRMEMGNLLALEKQKLIDGLSRKVNRRINRSADGTLPPPPLMLTKLLERKNLSKRSVSDSKSETWNVDADLETVYVPGRHVVRGTTRTKTCLTPSGSLATCVEFHLDSETVPRNSTVEKISLWMYYKIPSSHSGSNRTLEIHELHRHGSENHARSELLTSVSILSGIEEGWIEAELSALKLLRNSKILRIQWREHVHVAKPPVSLDDHKFTPFLEISTRNANIFRERTSSESAPEANFRMKRHSSPAPVCTPNHHHCCLRNFYVNFSDFGWDSWIVAPSGYSAGYCAGRCTHRSDSGLNGRLVDRLTSKPACCAPSRSMDPLQIVYVDRSQGADKLVYRSVILPNMIVTGCKCQ